MAVTCRVIKVGYGEVIASGLFRICLEDGMKAKLTCLLCICGMLTGCAHMATQTSRNSRNSYRAPSTCFSGYPQGTYAGSPYAVTKAYLSFQLMASYTFKDPSLAHENVPTVFVADMNAVASKAQYVIADGSAGNFTIHLNVFQDSTQDHYGMSVSAYGVPKIGFNGYDPSHTQDTVEYFQFTLPAQYVSGSKLIEDAATKAAGFLNNGWTCN
jgi:hypothetical protein